MVSASLQGSDRDHRVDEPMAAEQAVRLKALAEEALEPEAFRRRLSRSQAAVRIAALEAKLRLQDGPPHTL